MQTVHIDQLNCDFILVVDDTNKYEIIRAPLGIGWALTTDKVSTGVRVIVHLDYILLKLSMVYPHTELSPLTNAFIPINALTTHSTRPLVCIATNGIYNNKIVPWESMLSAFTAYEHNKYGGRLMSQIHLDVSSSYVQSITSQITICSPILITFTSLLSRSMYEQVKLGGTLLVILIDDSTIAHNIYRFRYNDKWWTDINKSPVSVDNHLRIIPMPNTDTTTDWIPNTLVTEMVHILCNATKNTSQSVQELSWIYNTLNQFVVNPLTGAQRAMDPIVEWMSRYCDAFKHSTFAHTYALIIEQWLYNNHIDKIHPESIITNDDICYVPTTH